MKNWEVAPSQNPASEMEMMPGLDFTEPKTFFISFLLVFLIVFLRYLSLSGAYHWLFLIVLRKKLKQQILISQKANREQVKRELILSSYSALIFSFMGVVLLVLWQEGFTQIYAVNAYPLWYVPVSIGIYLLLHDFYYYWPHRWMHNSKWLRRFHMEHHRSVHTTVFTSFSFHPVESLLQAFIMPIIILILPMSVVAVLITLTFMTISAIINHAGVEIFPLGKRYRAFRKYLIGATHHDHHHKNARKNFGLYFTFWDRLMNTEK